jgi:hypothetical protein
MEAPDPFKEHLSLPLMHCTAHDSMPNANQNSISAACAQAHFEVGPVCEGCMRGTLATKDFQVKRNLCCYLIMVSQSHLSCPVCMPPQAKPRSVAPQQMHLTVLCHPGVAQQARTGALCCRAAN